MQRVRIDDLAEPRRTADELAAWEYGLSLDIDLDAERLVDEATAKTGLADFGDPAVLERLRAQVMAVEADEALSGIGRLIVRNRLVGLLAARLRFEDYTKRFPEALELELEPPVIVVGLPRSGTTHLVNLLTVDSRFRSLPWWEAVEPTPFPGDGPGPDGVDPRFARRLADHEAAKAVAPLTELMHDRHPSVIEEECELMDLDLCTYVLEWHARVPAWRDHQATLDQDDHLHSCTELSRALTHLRGPNRWVLKCPQHLEHLGPLMRTFPDATVVFTWRDPVASVQSAITMLAYGDRLRRRSVDADELAGYWIDRLAGLLAAGARDLDRVPTEQRVDVPFDDLRRDDLAVLDRIHEAAGLPVDDTARARQAEFSRTHRRGHAGRVEYDLRGQFGLEPGDVRARFADSLAALPTVSIEVE